MHTRLEPVRLKEARPDPAPARSPARAPRLDLARFAYPVGVVVLVSAATWAVHGHALNDGLLLDDHLHRLRLAEDDWSWASFREATTIAPDQFVNAWWQEQPYAWHYFRPFAILVAKTVYHLSDGSVKAWHAISILLHLATAFLVYWLAWQLTRHRFWSVVAALLVVVYSHSVYAVSWLAAQNILLQTTLTLAGLLCYIRASSLDVHAVPRTEPTAGNRPAPPLRPAWLAAAVTVWVLALFSRENAIVLPFFWAAFDSAFGGRRHLLARWRFYVTVGIFACGFTFWRIFLFEAPMPDFYMQRPGGDLLAYCAWAFVQLLYYLTSAVWLSPMTIGTGARFNPITEVPVDVVLMLLILGAMGGGYWAAAGRARGAWIWPAWIVLAVLPVVPVLATPHSGYLPSVGFALAMVLGPALHKQLHPDGSRRWSVGVAIWFLIATTIYVPIYRPMWYSFLAAERETIQRVLADPPPTEARELFFINLPFINIYAPLVLQRAWGLDGLDENDADRRTLLGPWATVDDPENVPTRPQDDFRCHVLTYAPDVLYMDVTSTVTQLDAHRFTVSIEQRPWFSGALGRFLIEGMRANGPLTEQTEVLPTPYSCNADLFDVVVRRADAEGVWELEFAFHRPLASEDYCFYLGSPQSGAARLRFAPPDPSPEPLPVNAPATRAEVDATADSFAAGCAEAGEMLLAAAAMGDPHVASAAREAFARIGAPFLEAQGAPLWFTEDGAEAVLDDADWNTKRAWWRQRVDPNTYARFQRYRDYFDGLQTQRAALYNIRSTAGAIIRSDLYLTGPPYPGPRPVVGHCCNIR